MFVLDDKTYFWLFWVIPAVVLLFLLTRLWRRRAQKKFADEASLGKLSPAKSRFKPILKLVLFVLALSCLIIALVNPKTGGSTKTVKRKGVDIVFAVDVSRSMLAEDIAPNRMEKAKRLVHEIIDNLSGDRVGIVAYAGSAFPQLPMTTDYGAAKLFLKGLNTNMVSSHGTAIAQAIKLSQTFFDKGSQTNRVVILVTDGEDHAGEIKQVTKEAAEDNIHIITIGVGTAKGGRIPIKRNGVVQFFLKDQTGETVITRLDKPTLVKIAKATDGIYIDGSDTRNVVQKVTKYLNSVQKKKYETKEYASYADQFQWFLGFGIFFLILDMFLLERKTKWLQRLDLFNEKEKSDES